MHRLSILFFTIVVVIALNNVPTTAKTVPTTTIATTSTTLTPTGKAPVIKVNAKKEKKPAKKSKKPQQSSWKAPDADQKKLFNDYKTILRTKLQARQANISNTYQLEAAKYGLQTVDKSVLHHYLIKLPDGKYAHAIIGMEKNAKKPLVINEHNASIRRTIYDNLAAAEV